jgi:hypothetical protein
MTCEECELILADSCNRDSGTGWIPGVSVLNLAKGHAQDCPACAAKMGELCRLNDALEELRFSTMRLEAPASMERNLVAEFRRASSSVARTFRWKLTWGAATALILAAAGLMLYFGVRSRPALAIRGRQEVQQTPSSTKTNPTRQATESQRPRGVDRMLTITHDAPGSARLMQPQKRRQSSQPAGEELSLNGGGSVVRVTLPLSSLAAMGVPVHPDMSDKRVTADVAMDPFGAVIAIHVLGVKPSAD